MARPSAGADFIRMSGFEGKLGRPVVQDDSGVFHNDARSENVRDAGYERNHVAVLVDHCEILVSPESRPAVGAGKALLI